jgi:50S ribosomal subunit-associated GTPase HflX
MTYWEDALDCSLNEHGIVVPHDKLVLIASDMETAEQMHGEATGQHSIPHPFESERSDLERQIKKLKEELRQAEENFRMNVARRHNVHISQVTLETGGDAYVWL